MIPTIGKGLRHGQACGRTGLFFRAALVWRVGLVWLLMAASAYAHAALNRAEPADGARLAAPPAVIRLTFSEPVSPTRLTLTGPGREPFMLTETRLAGTTLEIVPPPALADGGYVLSYRVVSQDGHPIGGSVLFTLGQGPAASAAAVTDDRAVQAGLLVGKLALYFGLFFGIGGAFARSWFAGGRGAGLAVPVSALAVGFVGAALSAGFQGLDALGASLSALSEGESWLAGLATSFGASLVFASAAFACAGLALLQGPGAGGRWISLGALVAAGLALSLSGHASAADPQWLMRPAVFLHTVTIAVWAGALPVLFAVLRSEGALPALQRFSRVIPLLLLVLVLAGTVLAIVQLRSPAALLSTDYGRVFLVKLALLLPLFLLAAFNRWGLTARVQAGDAVARRVVLRIIMVETVLVALIFATAAVWRFTPPPRVLIAEAPPAIVKLSDETLAATVTLDRAAGRAEVTLAKEGGGSLDPLEVGLVMSQAEAGIEPIRRPAVREASGAWRVEGLDLPAGGRWSLRLDLVVSDFEIVRLEGPVTLD